MKQFTVIYNQDTNHDEDFVMHSAGCSDTKKYVGHDWVVEGEDVEAAIAEMLADFDHEGRGWERRHFHVMPCAQ